MNSNTASVIALFVLFAVTGISAAYFVIRDLRKDKIANKKKLENLALEGNPIREFKIKGVRLPLEHPCAGDKTQRDVNDLPL